MMLQDGIWNRYLHEVDEECHREVEQAVRRIMEKEGVEIGLEMGQVNKLDREPETGTDQ